MKITTKKSQQGLTLIEVMIAVVLGIFILTGIIQLFSSNLQHYRLQESLSRLQENGRFAINLITQDIRTAGYMGCIPTDQTIINLLLPADTYEVTDFIIGSEAISDSAWSPTLATTGITATSALGGSDIITIRKSTSVVGGSITNHAAAADNVTVTDSSNFSVADIVLAENCNQATVFKISAISMAGEIAHDTGSNTSADLAQTYEDGLLYKLLSRTYFIRNNAIGFPSLYRKDRDNANSEELIEGIESIQVLYGEDTDSTGSPNAYLTAENVTDMNDVISIKISLVARTVEDDLASAPIPYTIFGVTITPTDLVIRRVFSTTITIRNNLS